MRVERSGNVYIVGNPEVIDLELESPNRTPGTPQFPQKGRSR
jgi:hypothetical protein